MTTISAIPNVGDLIATDIDRLAPGCSAATTLGNGFTVTILTHRITGLTARMVITDDDWSLHYSDSSWSGHSAYGLDGALTHVYRHYLDFTSEHGPGTAWDYATRTVEDRARFCSCHPGSTAYDACRNGCDDACPVC